MRETVVTRDMIADPRSRYGDGRAATRHFLLQRLSGVANLVFIGFLVVIVVRLAGAGREDALAFLGAPWIGLPFAVLFAIVCVHMRIGMAEIVEDYVHDPRLHRLSLLLNTVVATAIGLLGAGAVLKIVFWG